MHSYALPNRPQRQTVNNDTNDTNPTVIRKRSRTEKVVNKCIPFTFYLSYFQVMRKGDPDFDLKINIGWHISWSSDFAKYL